MNLEIQIQSLIVSAVYGYFESLFYNLFYFILYNKNKIISLISCLIFNIFFSLMFYNILYIINNGVVHIYFISLFVLGFITGNHIFKRVRKEVKKKERN